MGKPWCQRQRTVPFALVRAAAVQLTSTDDLDRNLETADRLTRAAARDGAQLVVLPEKWHGLAGEAAKRSEQPLETGPVATWAGQTARELGIDLIAGSFAERSDDAGKPYNTSIHVDPSGAIRAHYRKIHLFDADIGGETHRASEHESPGDRPVTTTTEDGTRVGMAVCYDLRFPELFRILATEGAQVLTLPSAFTLTTTREHWEPLLRARAIENQAFVVAANQIGEHPGNIRTGGRSMIVDAWGVVLAQARDTETHVVADLDFATLDDARRRIPSLANRRPEAYRTGVPA
jgi:predicted amidohydrolase